MTVPFDRKIAEAYSRGETLLDIAPAWKDEFLGLFEAVLRAVA